MIGLLVGCGRPTGRVWKAYWKAMLIMVVAILSLKIIYDVTGKSKLAIAFNTLIAGS